jgi:glucokinase
MPRGKRIGIDIGATTIKGGLVDLRTGAIVVRARKATPAGQLAVLDAAATVAERIAGGRRSRSAVGVASCGLVSADGFVLETTETMPDWDAVDIPTELGKRLGRRVVADNDGNVATLAEAKLGAGRGVRHVAGLILGTGVGGGLVVDGRIFHGAGSMAATFGHLKVRAGGRRCACGAKGCLEAYASAWAFRRAARLEGREVFARARRGDPICQRIVDDAADALGAAGAQIAHAINPDVIVIGGAIGTSFRRMEARALTRFRDLALSRAFATTRLARAQLGADAGIVGAALLAAS